MTKTHYAHGPHGNACGRASSQSTTNVYRVTCLSCKGKEQFIAALALAEQVRFDAFMATEPRIIREPWREGHIVCSECGGDKFREGDRSCHGHYANYFCANCGHGESRLTETGMSF